MDSLSIGVVIGGVALFLLLFVLAPMAYRYDRRMARGRRSDDGGATVVSGAAVFGGDGGGGCSDGGGGSC